jgi:hypothetical protein
MGAVGIPWPGLRPGDHMDQFIDNLARELAKPTSRRGVMRLIGGAMLGGLVAAWKPASLEAQTCNPPCNAKKTCCTTGTSPFCITTGKQCCGNKKCNANALCCGSGASAFCATQGNTCCGKKSCKPTETCCNNTACCNAKQACVSGRCVASKT